MKSSYASYISNKKIKGEQVADSIFAGLGLKRRHETADTRRNPTYSIVLASPMPFIPNFAFDNKKSKLYELPDRGIVVSVNNVKDLRRTRRLPEQFDLNVNLFVANYDTGADTALFPLMIMAERSEYLAAAQKFWESYESRSGELIRNGGCTDDCALVVPVREKEQRIGLAYCRFAVAEGLPVVPEYPDQCLYVVRYTQDGPKIRATWGYPVLGESGDGEGEAMATCRAPTSNSMQLIGKIQDAFLQKGFSVNVETEDQIPFRLTARRRFEESVIYPNRFETTAFVGSIVQSRNATRIDFSHFGMLSATRASGYERLEDFQAEKYRIWFLELVNGATKACKLNL